MESLQLIRVLSCQLCPKLPKLGPSCISFRPFSQVGFGSLKRDQAEKVCLLVKRSINTGIGGDRGGYGGSGNHERSLDVEEKKGKERNVFTSPYRNVRIMWFSNLRLPPRRRYEKTSTGNGENQLLQNDQLKEIQDELTEIAQRSLNLSQQVAVLVKGIQQTTNDLIHQKSHEASNSESIPHHANESIENNTTGLLKSIQSPEILKSETPSTDWRKRKRENDSPINNSDDEMDSQGERPGKMIESWSIGPPN